MPLVLRPHTDSRGDLYYELIGECYLHTIMDGEAVGIQEEYQLPFERFELR